MKITRKIILTGITCFYVSGLWAGGLLTNTNQSVHFLRNPARDASIEIDAAYTNPAGLAWLPVDGFHFSINNQSASQTRTITSTFAPFAGFGGNATKVFEGKASAPIIPSLFGAYKKGNWVLSGNIAISGGGGKATFNNGLPSFEALVAVVPAVAGQMNPAVGGYSVDSYMEGSSIIYGAQLGGTYKINEMFSAYAGFRLNIVSNGYEGYMKNTKIGVAGNLLPVDNVIPEGSPLRPLYSLASEKELDCTQSGWGVAPIAGFNFNWQNQLNIGIKYEFKAALDVENKTKVDNTGMFKDGVNTPHDIPALLTVGASYKILPQLTASIGYHHFFDSDAKMSNNKQQYAGSTNEYLAGAEYQINPLFLVSAGAQITKYGVGDAYQQDLSFACDSYSIGIGGAVNVSPKVRINIGYFWTTYSDYTKENIADYGKINALSNGVIPAMQGTDVFSRTNKVFGAGVDFRF